MLAGVSLGLKIMARDRTSLTAKLVYMALGAGLLALLILLAFIFVPQVSRDLVAATCQTEGCNHDSAFFIAAQLGRLDVVSLVLGVLGIGVGAFAIFGLFAVKDHAEAVAENVARNVATDVATRVTAQRLEWVEPLRGEIDRGDDKTEIDPKTAALTSSSQKQEENNDGGKSN